MPIIAVLFAAPPPPGVAAPLLVGGITVLERQQRQLRRAGIAQLIVAGDTSTLPDLPEAHDALNDLLLRLRGVR